MFVRHQLVLVCAVLFLGLVPAASGGSTSGCVSPAGPAVCAASPTAPFVTPEQAQAAMTALWNTEERAYAVRDQGVLDAISSGSRLLEQHYAFDGLACGCWVYPWTKGPRTIEDLSIAYPRQTHFPLYLLAQIKASIPGTASSASAVLIVTRSGLEQPWRVSMLMWDTAYTPSVWTPVVPLIDPNGFDLPVTDPGAVTAWPSMLAAYFLHIKDDGAPPTSSEFLPGPATTGTDMATRRQGSSTSQGIVYHYAFHVSGEGAPWNFMLSGDGAMSCADILETNTQTLEKPNEVFVQHDGPGQAWGPDLPSGNYTEIVTTFDRPACISEINGRLWVLSPSPPYYPIHTTGVLAKPPAESSLIG